VTAPATATAAQVNARRKFSSVSLSPEMCSPYLALTDNCSTLHTTTAFQYGTAVASKGASKGGGVALVRCATRDTAV
jgi:hypothetical protein